MFPSFRVCCTEFYDSQLSNLWLTYDNTEVNIVTQTQRVNHPFTPGDSYTIGDIPETHRNINPVEFLLAIKYSPVIQWFWNFIRSLKAVRWSSVPITKQLSNWHGYFGRVIFKFMISFGGIAIVTTTPNSRDLEQLTWMSWKNEISRYLSWGRVG